MTFLQGLTQFFLGNYKPSAVVLIKILQVKLHAPKHVQYIKTVVNTYSKITDGHFKWNTLYLLWPSWSCTAMGLQGSTLEDFYFPYRWKPKERQWTSDILSNLFLNSLNDCSKEIVGECSRQYVRWRSAEPCPASSS